MSFNSFLVHQITTYRNLPNGVGIQKSYQQNLLNVPCLIQPVSAAYAAQVNQVFGRTYHLYLPLNTDITLTDKVIDGNGREYRVTGSLARSYGSSAPHISALITEQVQTTSTGTDI